MQRREFIKVIVGSAAAWPLAAQAQQPEQMRRIGVLMNRAENDAEGQARIAVFRQALEQLGWNEGRNMRIDIRWGEDKIDLEHKYAAELVALAPDVILASGTDERGGVASSQPYATDRVRGSRRSGRCRLRRVHGAARR